MSSPAAIFQGSTARYLIEDVVQLRPGITCPVHAASSGTGQMLVQFAKRRGATVFATASNDAMPASAAPTTYESGRFADRIRAATAGRGVDVVFDAVGRATLRDSFRATRSHGLVINYGFVSGSLDDLDPYELGEAGALFLTRPHLADYLAEGATVQRLAPARSSPPWRTAPFASTSAPPYPRPGRNRPRGARRPPPAGQVGPAHFLSPPPPRSHHCLRPGWPIDLLPFQGMGG